MTVIEDDDEYDGSDIIRAKWSMDGASTLTEAAHQLRLYASSLEKLESEGWQLTGPVEDDYGFIEKR